MKIRDYQLKAIDLIKEVKRVLLAMQMGAGKSLISLKAFSDLKKEGKANRMLIVAPNFVANYTWPEEIEKWKNLVGSFSYNIISGNKKQREKSMELKTDISIINIENIVWLFEEYKDLIKKEFDIMIFDESSSLAEAKKKTKLKNLTRYSATFEISKLLDYVVLLSGTPTPNGIKGIFGQAQCLKDKILATSKTAFLKQYFDDVGYKFPDYRIKNGAREEIIKKMGLHMFQLDTDKILDLPECFMLTRKVEENKKIKKMMNELKNNFILNLECDKIIVENETAKRIKLFQMCSGGIYKNKEKDFEILHEDKIKVLKEIIAEVDGNGILVLYNYEFEKKMIKDNFKNACFASDEGNIKKFEKGDIPILFAHPKQVGAGLNFQEYNNITVWLTLPTSLFHYLQANKRMHRSGQKKVVSIYHILNTNLEVELFNLLNNKKIDQEEFLKLFNSISVDI